MFQNILSTWAHRDHVLTGFASPPFVQYWFFWLTSQNPPVQGSRCPDQELVAPVLVPAALASSLGDPKKTEKLGHNRTDGVVHDFWVESGKVSELN